MNTSRKELAAKHRKKGMNTEEKREFLIRRITEELEKSPVTIQFSSPSLKAARRGMIVIAHTAKPESEKPPWHPMPAEYPEKDPVIIPSKCDAYTINAEHEDENVNPKQLAREQKKREKEEARRRKKNEKAYRKMQKDITKRGFDTAVLQRLNDPADIYHMSDDEIREIEIAGVINSDGYYNFVYPEDYDAEKQSKTSRKTVLLVGGFVLSVMILLVILINNIFRMF